MFSLQVLYNIDKFATEYRFNQVRSLCFHLCNLLILQRLKYDKKKKKNPLFFFHDRILNSTMTERAHYTIIIVSGF